MTAVLEWSPINCISPGSHSFNIWLRPLLPWTLMFACTTAWALLLQLLTLTLQGDQYMQTMILLMKHRAAA